MSVNNDDFMDMKKSEITNNMFNVFRCIMEINQYSFLNKNISDVIENLADIVNLDYSMFYEKELKERIYEFCDVHDTGIYH